jgi:hypothetical protein
MLDRARAPETDAKAVSLLGRVWIEMERMKREMRGIPPLSGHKLNELLRDARSPRDARHAPLELDADEPIDEGKASLNSQTVTAPPAPKPPEAMG